MNWCLFRLDVASSIFLSLCRRRTILQILLLRARRLAPSFQTPLIHRQYTIQAGDTFLNISKAQNMSTALLWHQNSLAAETGATICLPLTCHVYTLQANETCFGVSQAYGGAFVVTRLISWNPGIN